MHSDVGEYMIAALKIVLRIRVSSVVYSCVYRVSMTKHERLQCVGKKKTKIVNGKKNSTVDHRTFICLSHPREYISVRRVS